MVLRVRVVGGAWVYQDVQRGKALFPCGDAKAAGERVDLVLKGRMFPATW
ncbi:hypothetical protein [Actinomadura citrea]|uniref:Uncharacterized protein n=2 Tax=Thermomonosporaceae TaxID=2012 RepID=A0A7Y9G5V2_9ACTN|nr:hypothetical protein [Actinomadura citrea]NYE10439.1 hypothetical protein [Actinomadura citrea]